MEEESRGRGRKKKKLKGKRRKEDCGEKTRRFGRDIGI